MPKGRLAWGGLLLVGAALEGYGIANPESNDTLSEFTRWAFATDITAGRVAFAVCWIAFAGWYLVHILGGRNRDK